MTIPNHIDNLVPSPDDASHAEDVGFDLEELDGDCGDIIASMQSVQISTPQSLNFSLISTPAGFSSDVAGLGTAFSPRGLPDSPGFIHDPHYYSPPLVESSSGSWSSSSVHTPAGLIAPAFRIMDLPSSGESGYMNPMELYSDSNTGSPTEYAPKPLCPTDLPREDSEDGFIYSPELIGEPRAFHAHFHQHVQLPATHNHHHHNSDGSSCQDCRRVGEEFRNFLLALNEPGAALAFDDEDAEAVEETVAEIYAMESEEGYEPDPMIVVPNNISMFSFDLELFLPSPPDRSSEFLALGADPTQVKTWAEDYFEDVDELRREWEGKFASGARNFELELAPHGEELKQLARDALRNFVEVRFDAEVNDWVEEDLEKCRRGEWFLSRSPPGTSGTN